MKTIKRFLGNLILTIILFALIAVCVLLGIGYVNYKQTIAIAPISETVSKIMEQDNYVTYEELSPYLINATIAIEDRNFFEHTGVDYKAITRSFISNLTTGEIVSGGSTITQQVIKNLYFDFDYSFLRKVSEIFFAYDLESQYSKEEILSLYVNIINYGDNHMGIYEASYGYFNKGPNELGLDEASLIAGIPQSPSNYQLSIHLKEAKLKQKRVLKAMIECKMLSKEEKLYVYDLYDVD